MFQQKMQLINNYEGIHFLMKLRAAGYCYISIFLQFLR